MRLKLSVTPLPGMLPHLDGNHHQWFQGPLAVPVNTGNEIVLGPFLFILFSVTCS